MHNKSKIDNTEDAKPKNVSDMFNVKSINIKARIDTVKQTKHIFSIFNIITPLFYHYLYIIYK